ncbi:MAG: hypothetical protein WBQ26_13645 [Gemmatimonadaceae bacterium]|nr:hypothetical protein [Gemmatimonadaceae bacterium]
MRINSLVLCVALAASVGGCAPSGTPSSSAPTPSHRFDLITADELAGRSFANAYDAIQQLRPSMLAQRGGAASSSLRSGPPALQVYVDNTSIGGVSGLRDLPAGGIKEIRYLSPTDATQRFGTGNAGGAIVISTH